MKRYLPILEWLPKYQLSWLRYDIVAGLAVWAVLVPTSMAYAGIAGVPPLVGLYTVPATPDRLRDLRHLADHGRSGPIPPPHSSRA